MDSNKITQFRDSIKGFTLEELQAKKDELEANISKMILDSDLVMYVAIVNAAIEEHKKDSKIVGSEF